jgi:tetratricopeptide (TPR) repeat protein
VLFLSCSRGEEGVSKTIKESEYLIQAKEALLQGDWDKVIQYGEEGIEKDPEDAILCQLLLSAYWFGGDRFLEKVFKFWSEKKRVFEQKDFWTKNLNWAQKLYKKHPQNYYAVLYLGYLNRHTNNNKNAIIVLEKAIEINPQLYEGYYEMGITFLDKKSLKNSEDYLKKVLKYTKKAKGVCFFNLAETYFGLKEYDLAIDYALRAEEKILGNPRIYMFLGAIIAIKGDLRTAKSYWEEVIKLDPDGEMGRLAQKQMLSLPK